MSGFVTAELAVALPAVVIALAALLAAAVAGIGHLQCVDAARETARVAARNEPTTSAIAAGRRLAPKGAHITVATTADLVTATVTAEIATRLPGTPSIRVEAQAVTTREPESEPVAGIAVAAAAAIQRRRRGRPRRRRLEPRTRHAPEPASTDRRYNRIRDARNGRAGATRGRGPVETARYRAPLGAERDRGAGAVLVLGLVLLGFGLAVAAAGVGRVVIARHEAVRAADLTALGAATVAVTRSPPVEPCAVAADLAVRNGARLVSCAVDGAGVAEVAVEVAAGRFEATARARAGPAEVETL